MILNAGIDPSGVIDFSMSGKRKDIVIGMLSVSAFEPLWKFPELNGVLADWRLIRDEALKSVESMLEMPDNRSENGEWKALPLMLEKEDWDVVHPETQQAARRLVPHTVRLVEAIPRLRAYAFSLVEPNGQIKAHKHSNPFVSVSLCLQGGGHSHIIVDGERREFRDGEAIVFDYRRVHEVVNRGDKQRIAFIIAIEKGVDRVGPSQVRAP